MLHGAVGDGKMKPRWEIDTLEKAWDVIEVMRWVHKKDDFRFRAIESFFEKYPDVLRCAHVYIGEILGMERETVSRLLNKTTVQNGKVRII